MYQVSATHSTKELKIKRNITLTTLHKTQGNKTRFEIQLSLHAVLPVLHLHFLHNFWLKQREIIYLVEVTGESATMECCHGVKDTMLISHKKYWLLWFGFFLLLLSRWLWPKFSRYDTRLQRFLWEVGEEHNDITHIGLNEIDNLTFKFYTEAVICWFSSLLFNREY